MGSPLHTFLETVSVGWTGVVLEGGGNQKDLYLTFALRIRNVNGQPRFGLPEQAIRPYASR